MTGIVRIAGRGQSKKYGQRKTQLFGMEFDSQAEALRYGVLREREQNGEIRGLRTQVKYELQPAFTDAFGNRVRAITFYVDFAYIEVATGRQVVEDVKGLETDDFVLKRKMFRYRYPDVEFRTISVRDERPRRGLEIEAHSVVRVAPRRRRSF